ncbi:MAG: hypothetical protein GWP05_09500 [Anaerolineaceae bacterium]|nr:hypothetical protein [Anaerolineaceae bacterium]
MSTCDREQLLLLAAGELDAPATAALEAHLASCRRCAEELEQLRETLALVGRLPEAEPSGVAVERIRTAAAKALARRRRGRPGLGPSFAHRYRYALAAAAMLAAIIGWSIVQEMVGRPGSNDVAVVDRWELEDQWRETMDDVADSTVLMDDLDALQESDPWTKVAGAVDTDLGDQLQQTLDYLELIEEDPVNGS